MTNNVSGSIQTRTDFKDNPEDQYKYWDEEITGAQSRMRRWHKDGDRIVKRFIDYRGDVQGSDFTDGAGARLNLFHSNVVTLQSMLYGNVPKVDVSRRYADPNDDVSRVAAEIMERLLNNDIQDNGEEITCVLRATLQDRLLPGLACARVRYDVKTEQQGEEEVVVWEDAPVDYFHWRDVLWGWSRMWAQVPWLAYRSWLNQDEATSRFGEETAKLLEYRRQSVNDNKDSADDTDMASVWQKAEIWEIWDKVKRQVVFYSKGYCKILETRDDPLQLSGFYPSPPFFMANPTTSLYAPTPDFHLARNLYNVIDALQTRIEIITSAVKVVGVYDAAAEGIQRMFKEGMDNQLIPVDSWALFAEKGGIAGQVDWIPLGEIVAALDKLRELRSETIELLYQVTGMADILRGGGGQYEGVGQAELKAKFASVRVQALQDEFATFASHLMQIKAEVICRHFSPANIALRANIENTFDADVAPKALELLKQPEMARLRVVIRPETVAMVDYAQLKQERTEYINALAIFMQSAAPLLEQDPRIKPYLMRLLQWGLSGFKGSSEIEGILDKAIDASEQDIKEGGGEQPDPAVQAQQMAMQLEQMRQQAELAKIQAKATADLQLRIADRDADIATTAAEHQAKMEQIQAETASTMAETAAKMEADVMVQRVQSEAALVQTQTAAATEIEKDVINAKLDIEKELNKTHLKIKEIQETAKKQQKTAKTQQGGGNET